MITVGALLDLDLMAYVFAGVAVITGVLFRLVRLQLRHQRAEEAAVDRWRRGSSGD